MADTRHSTCIRRHSMSRRMLEISMFDKVSDIVTEALIVELLSLKNRKVCALCDKSMKLGTQLVYTLKVILRSGATSDLTFCDL